MLTRKQKRILENKIYNVLKKGLREQKERMTRDQIVEMHMFNMIHENKDKVSQRLRQVTAWLKDPSVDKAQVAYKMFGVSLEGEDDNEKKNARGLFMKKLNNEPLPSGSGTYEFTEEETNTLFDIMTNQKGSSRINEYFEGTRGAINGFLNPKGQSRIQAAKQGYINGRLDRADKIKKQYSDRDTRDKDFSDDEDFGVDDFSVDDDSWNTDFNNNSPQIIRGSESSADDFDDNSWNTGFNYNNNNSPQIITGGESSANGAENNNNENIPQPEAQPETQVQPQATPQYQENSNMRPAGPYGQYYSTQTGNMNYDYQSGNLSQQQQPIAARQTRGKTYKANAQGRSNTGNIQSMVPQELLDLGNKALGYIQNGKRQYSTQAQRQFIQQAVPFLQRLAGQ